MNIPLPDSDQSLPAYYLGLPAWAFAGWKDRYFVDSPSRLGSYASIFNTVEGNTSFYSTPAEATVERWYEAMPAGFRPAFKLPQSVTHRPRPGFRELTRFLDVMDGLAERRGPYMIQLPASVDSLGIERLEPVFEQVATRGRFVIEVRHRTFFEQPELLEPWLQRYAAGRVMLDSRPIYEGDRSHPEVLDALHEKPDVPVLDTVYGDLPFVRLILHPDIVSNDPWLDAWADTAAAWISEGLRPFIMIHCPNNLHCPPLAADFHERLRARTALAALPPWPVPEQQALL
jgi:uncharacterized protein YecE (DUF72 family)